MKYIRLARLFAILALFCALTLGRTEEKSSPAFVALTIEAAGQQAAASHKIVFVDFYTTWCGPCKMLDQTTWQDPSVLALLRDKAVALRLDAENEKDLAHRYKINAYPTLLLLKPDGTEIDRIVGYREPTKFIEEFTAGLAGKTALQRAREAVSSAANEHDRIMARYRLGDELARGGQTEAALAEYLWCYDEGMAKEPDFRGVRYSFLLASIVQLGHAYPPALAALEKRRDKARAALQSGSSDRDISTALVSLNQCLEADADSLAVYNRLPKGDVRRHQLGRDLFRKLLEAHRYQDVLEDMPYSAIQERWTRWQAEESKDAAIQRPAEIRRMQQDYLVKWLAEHLEVLAGAGDLTHARELLATALAFDASDAARAAYRDHLTSAGHAELLAAKEPAPASGI